MLPFLGSKLQVGGGKFVSQKGDYVFLNRACNTKAPPIRQRVPLIARGTWMEMNFSMSMHILGQSSLILFFACRLLTTYVAWIVDETVSLFDEFHSCI